MSRRILLPALTALILAACAVKPSYQPPALIQSVQPVYPPHLEEEGISGEVSVQMHINTQGSVSEVRVLSATLPAFASSAKLAVAQFRFTPAKRNGQPVESSITQIFRFRALEPATDNSEATPHPALPSQFSPTR